MKVRHKHTKETLDNVFDCGWCYVGIACVNSENKIVMVEKQYYEPISDEEPIWRNVTGECAPVVNQTTTVPDDYKSTLRPIPIFLQVEVLNVGTYRLRKVPHDLGRQGTGWAFLIERKETE